MIGIIATDGNLSPDGRHISITSKDKEVVETVRCLLGLKNKLGRKARGGSVIKKYYVLQFGDINFYEFLLGIGLMPAKSKILKSVNIPAQYFADFFRGCVDGDGNISGFAHPESKFLQIRIRLVSASPVFLEWMLQRVQSLLHIQGGAIYKVKGSSVSVLSFGKADSKKLFKYMYYGKSIPMLQRKYRMALQVSRGE